MCGLIRVDGEWCGLIRVDGEGVAVQRDSISYTPV